ncbi:cadherin-10a isoform X1 [Hippocampus zosterae]|uniref:cadherin-10a isoform X1 n=1 Tax=Hippocampus zosterae TaxID=109293 RepID=UPI00223C9D35|nr:cadherin-10a isoform X1 [Hippocampus zosterae]XP_051910617.1 cadherin-10a isoform X1 [Hippocampus zosterae]XP_051910618.1 cadherin-10a isoform X1 [Hippocampus zosterae]
MLVDQVVLMLCTLWPAVALPLAPGNIGNVFAMQEGDGRILQRSKRGWMWNQFFLMEEYTGNDHQYVGKLHSNMDKDDGTVKYVLTGDGAGTIFLIDEKSGDIHATKRLDREERSMYTLHAKVLDRTTNEELEPDTEFNIKIHDINDNAPKFERDIYFASVPEMSEVGTSVATVTATDADDQTYGNSAKLVYSILQGQPYFSVDSENGTIKTALPGMDREVKENYQVVIQAKDMAGQMGGLSGTTTVSITLSDVNDSPPRFANHSFRITATESAEIGGAVGRIKADDSDVGRNAEMEYSIVGSHDNFNVVTDKATQEGVIIIKEALDYESKRDYEFRVEVRNTYLDARYIQGLEFKDFATVKVTVEDVDEPPVFTRNPYIIEVHEDTAAGSFVGVVSARDPDAEYNMVKYSIDRHTDLEMLFNIDSSNGTITTRKALDREMSKWHNISVMAAEISTSLHFCSVFCTTNEETLTLAIALLIDNPRQVARVPVFIKVLDVNDNAPEFAMAYDTFVCENVNAGQLIQTISAVDTDEPLIGHKFAFSIKADNPNFTISDQDDNTANILTRRGGFSRREMSVYFLPVVISDNDYPIQSSTSTLIVRVCACDSRGNMQSCNPEVLPFSDGLTTGALVAILLCVIILLMIVVLFAALKRQRKKEPLIISKDDVRDNVVSYNDEGGGEEDTQAFDIGTLRNPEVMDANKLRRDIIPEMLFSFRRTSPIKDNTDVRDFINGRLQENDSDPTAPPYDSLATYAYEGSGSLAESLSSLESATTEGDQDYDYLSSWGPQFKKLAEMYIGRSPDRQT